MSVSSNFRPLAVALAASLLALGASAQTLDGKAPANGKLMGFNELKACIVQQEELKGRRVALESQRSALDSERAAIDQEAQTVRAEQQVLAQRNAEVKAFNEKLKAYSEKVKAFNEKAEELRTGAASERTKERAEKELEREQRALQAEAAADKVTGDKLMADMKAFVEKINVKADAQAAKATDWNARSKALEDNFVKYEDNRVDWRANCGDRRYREEDEKLIRSDLAKGLK